MKGYEYIDQWGSFRLNDPELTSYLYFPIANENGVMSSVTPALGGDSKTSQNTFLLAPVSSEDLHNNKSSRNFWCRIEGKGIWSATGKSAWQEALKFTGEKEETVLEAGILWHKVTRSNKKLGITSVITSFAPCTGDTVELMMVTIKNTGEESLGITPISAIPLYGRSADNIRDHRHVTSLLHRIETRKEGILVNPTLTFDERGHRINTVVYGVFGCAGEGEEPVGFYPVNEDFIGEGGSFENPRAVYEEEISPVSAGYQISGYEALGGICFKKITLEPGGEKTYILVLGYGDSIENILETARKYLSPKACLAALEASKNYWKDKLNISYQTASKDFDTWMQWVNFQPVLRRIYGCSFLPHHDYGKGGRGWRDLWQDCLALLIMNPEGVRSMLKDNFAGVRLDGSNATIIGNKQGEFIADRNNITRLWMDHGVWPFLTTKLYIMQSGDVEFLLEENTYFKDPQGKRGDGRDDLWKPSDGNEVRTHEGNTYRGTVLEHMLIQHLTAFYDVGEHNHIRLRGADWNDALDMAKERGESVAFTAIYGDNLEQLADLILTLSKQGKGNVSSGSASSGNAFSGNAFYGNNTSEDNSPKTISLMKEMEILLKVNLNMYEDVKQKQELLNEYCTQCLHTVSGEKITYSCEELAAVLKAKAQWIKNHIKTTEWLTNKEGFSWYNSYYDNKGRKVEGDFENGVRMMLTGQVFAIMSGTASNDQTEAIIKAADKYLYDSSIGGYKLNTDFKEIKTDLGRMFGFAYGSKENGAVFSHMAVMYANALYQRNYAAEGYKVIKSLYEHLRDFEKSKIYPGIPEYIGDNGRGLCHYLTGSASWLLLTVLNEMFGVKGEFGGLKLEPKLMSEQFDNNKQAGVKLVFAGRKLNIVYSNSDLKEAGTYRIGQIKINGKHYVWDGAEPVIKRKDIEELNLVEEHVIWAELI